MNRKKLIQIIGLGTLLLGAGQASQASLLNKIVFKVPLNVTQIHPEIQYIAPMCRIFTGTVMNNANQLGSVRPNIAVSGRGDNRKVMKSIKMNITANDLSPGRSINDVTAYTCTLYVKKTINGKLLTYSTTSTDAVIKAAKSPVIVAKGSIDKCALQKGDTIHISTSKLKAQGVSRIVSLAPFTGTGKR